MDKITSIVKYIRKDKGIKAAKTILKNANKVGGMSLLDFQTYIATVIKTVGIGRGTDTQINGTE